jgi:hypothetical protein
MDADIRPERLEDVEAIHDVTTAAFLNAPHTSHTEQFIVPNCGARAAWPCRWWRTSAAA